MLLAAAATGVGVLGGAATGVGVRRAIAVAANATSMTSTLLLLLLLLLLDRDSTKAATASPGGSGGARRSPFSTRMKNKFRNALKGVKGRPHVGSHCVPCRHRWRWKFHHELVALPIVEKVQTQEMTGGHKSVNLCMTVGQLIGQLYEVKEKQAIASRQDIPWVMQMMTPAWL